MVDEPDWSRLEQYRAERANELDPLREEQQAAEAAAIAFAQAGIKTGMLLNGGGMLAIPAIIALFNLDAISVQKPLVTTGVLFTGGLIVSWASYFTAFFAMSNKVDFTRQDGIRMARVVQGNYFPEQASLMKIQAAEANIEKDKFLCYYKLTATERSP